MGHGQALNVEERCSKPRVIFRVVDELPGGRQVAYLEPDMETVEILARRDGMTEGMADELSDLINAVIETCGWGRGN